MDWDDYHVFLELLRSGSLSGAAKTIGLTHATIRRRLEEMERLLGVVLFTRSPDGLKPTAAAQKLQPAAILMESGADSLMRVAPAAGSAIGVVKIVCGEIMAVEVLPPAFAILRALQPGVRLAVSIDNNPVHALRGTADISIQLIRPTHADVFSTLACRIPVGLFAHGDYVAEFGAPKSIEDLNSFSLIGSDTESFGQYLLRTQGVDIDPGDFVVRSDRVTAQLAAIRAGVGIGAMPVPLATRDPGLVRILPGLEYVIDKWVAMHEHLRRDRRVRVTYDFITDHLAAYARDSRPSVAASSDMPPPEGLGPRGPQILELACVQK